MAWTEVLQCNRALSLIGASSISALGVAGDPVSIMLDNIFDTCRDVVLQSHEWPFAIKRADLTEVAAWVTATAYEVDDYVFTADNVYICLVAHTSGTFATDLASAYWLESYKGPTYHYTTCYFKPSDYLKGLEVSDDNADWAIEGEIIVADTSSLELKYIHQVTDPTKWSTAFIEAFAAYLASEIAFSITSSKTTMEAMQKMYAVKIEEAAASESQVGRPPKPRQDQWEEGRLTDD